MSGRGSSVLLLGERFARRWAVLCTSGLPHEVALVRRMEIESDLYEHAVAAAARGVPPLRTGLAILQRTVAGAPADVVWRRQQLAALRSSGDSVGRVDGRRRTMLKSTADEPKAWRPLPAVHLFDQLNDVVDITDPTPDPHDAGDDDRVVVRNAANIAGGIAAGGLQ